MSDQPGPLVGSSRPTKGMGMYLAFALGLGILLSLVGSGGEGSQSTLLALSLGAIVCAAITGFCAWKGLRPSAVIALIMLCVALLGAAYVQARVFVKSPTDLDVVLAPPKTTPDQEVQAIATVLGEIRSIRPASRFAFDSPGMSRWQARQGDTREVWHIKLHWIVQPENNTRAPVSGNLIVAVPVLSKRSTDQSTDPAAGWPRVGSIVKLTGRYIRDFRNHNPGDQFDHLYRAQDHIVGLLIVDSALAIELGTEARSTLGLLAGKSRQVLHDVRQHVGSKLQDLLTRHDAAEVPHDRTLEARAMLRAMMLGGRNEFGQELDSLTRPLAQLGMVHVLSISGFHMALIAWLTMRVVRLFGDQGMVEPLLGAAAVGIYVLLVPAEAPILRSAIMSLAIVLAEVRSFRYARLSILGWAAIAVMLWRPVDVLSIGFLLTFLVTGALLGTGSRWKVAILQSKIFSKVFSYQNKPWEAARSGVDISSGVKGRVYTPKHLRNPWARAINDIAQTISSFVAGALATTALAWTIASPVLAYRIGMITFLGTPVGMVLTLPAAAGLALGVLGLIISFVPGGHIFATLLLDLAVWACELVTRASFSMSRLSPPWSELVAMDIPQLQTTWGSTKSLLWFIFALACALGALARWRLAFVSAALCAMLLILAISAGFFDKPLSSNAAGMQARFEIVRLAMSGSHTTVIRGRDHRNAIHELIVDPGSSSVSDSQRLVTYFRALGVWRGPTVVLTTASPASIAHIEPVLASLAVREVVLSNAIYNAAKSSADAPITRALKAIEEHNTPLRLLGPDSLPSAANLPTLRVMRAATNQIALSIDLPGQTKLLNLGKGDLDLARRWLVFDDGSVVEADYSLRPTP